jgi:hypothetical protein
MTIEIFNGFAIGEKAPGLMILAVRGKPVNYIKN